MTRVALAPLDGGRVKRSRASLVGGIAVGLGVFALWWVMARDFALSGPAPIALGALVGALIALWIWRADL